MSQNNGTSRRDDIPRPRLEITTPAVRNPGVTVELEPGVSVGERKKYKVNWLSYS